MTRQTLREVNAPYTVDPDDESVGRETIIIRKNGEPVAAIVPYAEYQEWLALKPQLASVRQPSEPPVYAPLPVDPEFEKQWAAFQRLRPELLQKYPSQWVAIVNEQVGAVGPNFDAVAEAVYTKYGNVPRCIGQVREQQRVYHFPYRKVIRREN